MIHFKKQISIRSGFILLGLFNLVIIGIVHGIAPIGIILLTELLWPTPFDLNLVLLLLGWPGIILLFYEMVYAKIKNKMLRSSVFLPISGLLTLSIFGLISRSEAPVLSLLTALPFFIGLTIFLIRIFKNSSET